MKILNHSLILSIISSLIGSLNASSSFGENSIGLIIGGLDNKIEFSAGTSTGALSYSGFYYGLGGNISLLKPDNGSPFGVDAVAAYSHAPDLSFSFSSNIGNVANVANQVVSALNISGEIDGWSVGVTPYLRVANNVNLFAGLSYSDVSTEIKSSVGSLKSSDSVTSYAVGIEAVYSAVNVAPSISFVAGDDITSEISTPDGYTLSLPVTFAKSEKLDLVVGVNYSFHDDFSLDGVKIEQTNISYGLGAVYKF